MIVVSDTSPIINLAAIGKLDLLHVLYGEVFIPNAVYREIASFADQPGASEVQTLNWIARRTCEREDLVRALRGELDEGEAEAIALAVEMQADLLLIDERAGRRAATRLGLERIGLLGVLLEAKQQGHLNALAPLLDALRQEAGFWISESLRHRVLELAGE